MIGNIRQQESLRSPPRAVANSLADLSHDVTVLFELQAKLFRAELENSVQKVVWPIAMFVGAAIIALSSVPMLLFCSAYALIEFAELSHTLSFGLAALLGFVLAVVLGAIGYFAFKKMGSPFSQSQSELKRNIEWIRLHLKPGAGDAQRSAPASYS